MNHFLSKCPTLSPFYSNCSEPYYDNINGKLSPKFNINFTYEDIKEVMKRNGIETLLYEDFKKDFFDSTRFPDATPPPPLPVEGFFAFTWLGKIYVVLCRARFEDPAKKADINLLIHMLKHESIHIKQYFKSKNRLQEFKKDPNEYLKDYYSNDMEVMAFSQSIADILINQEKVKSVEDGINSLKYVQLWRYGISSHFSKNDPIIKRYKRNIYNYLKNHFDKINK